MIDNWRNILAIIVVMLFGFGLFYLGTDGFTAYTVETARVNQLKAEKPIFPDVMLEDSNGHVYAFSEFEGKHVLITFIYTACETLCLELEMNMAQVYQLVPDKWIGEEIVFLSISFDPTRDDPETLDKYKDYFNSDGETWRMARINDQTELDNLLKAFGVIVIPDQNGNFAHNAAFYFVDPAGTLIDVLDYQEIEAAAEQVINVLEEGV